jgi:hypothetical protein
VYCPELFVVLDREDAPDNINVAAVPVTVPEML